MQGISAPRSAIAALIIVPAILTSCAPPVPREQGVRCADVFWGSDTIHRVCSKDRRVEVMAIKSDNVRKSQDLLPRSAAIATDLDRKRQP